jgi:hypothetical protein
LTEIGLWKEELLETAPEATLLKSEEIELRDNLANIILHDNLSSLLTLLVRAEQSKDWELSEKLTHQIQEVHNEMRALEQKKIIL